MASPTDTTDTEAVVIGKSLKDGDLITTEEASDGDKHDSVNMKPFEAVESHWDDPEEPDKSGSTLASITFLMCGVGAVLKWQAFVQSAKGISETIYSFKAGPDTLSIVYYIFSNATALVVLKYGLIRLYLVYVGLFLTMVSAILFALFVQIISDRLIGLILAHIMAGLLGLFMSLTAANTFSLSSVASKNFTGFVVAGNGLSGLISAAVWQLATNFGWDINDAAQLPAAVWVLFCSVIPFIVIAVYSYYKLCQRSWFRKAAEGYISVIRDPEMGYKPGTGQAHLPPHLRCRRKLPLFKKCMEPMFLGALTLAISYSLFPNLGPNQWVKTRDDAGLASLLASFNQIIDFVGRFTPNVLPMLLMSPFLLRVVVYARLLWFVVYFLFYLIEDSFFENPYIQGVVIVIFAFIAGFTASQSLADVPKVLKTTCERGVAGILSHVSMQQGVLWGLLISFAIKFLNPEFAVNLFTVPPDVVEA